MAKTRYIMKYPVQISNTYITNLIPAEIVHQENSRINGVIPILYSDCANYTDYGHISVVLASNSFEYSIQPDKEQEAYRFAYMMALKLKHISFVIHIQTDIKKLSD